MLAVFPAPSPATACLVLLPPGALFTLKCWVEATALLQWVEGCRSASPWVARGGYRGRGSRRGEQLEGETQRGTGGRGRMKAQGKRGGGGGGGTDRWHVGGHRCTSEHRGSHQEACTEVGPPDSRGESRGSHIRGGQRSREGMAGVGKHRGNTKASSAARQRSTIAASRARLCSDGCRVASLRTCGDAARLAMSSGPRTDAQRRRSAAGCGMRGRWACRAAPGCACMQQKAPPGLGVAQHELRA